MNLQPLSHQPLRSMWLLVSSCFCGCGGSPHSEPTLQSREAWLPTCVGFPASKVQVSPRGATWGLLWVSASVST